MRSRASYQGHPIHPALIPFPFAFLTGAFVFDAAAWLFGWSDWWNTGKHLAGAGVVMALVAAVPGAIDYVYTVPPASTGKKRARKHAIFNLSAVAIVATAWVLRNTNDPALSIVALELIATGLLSAGGYMGGTLVNRNQIGIDHRYADAGKWQEQTIDYQPGQSVSVGKSKDLKVNQMKLVRVGDLRVVVARTEDGFVAFDDRCTHRGGSLAGGTMICGTVQCPWHGSQYDVKTGELKSGPATGGIGTYRIEEREGELKLTITPTKS